MSLWIELVVSVIFLLLMVVLCFYITRMATIPLAGEMITIFKKRRQAMQQKAAKNP